MNNSEAQKIRGSVKMCEIKLERIRPLLKGNKPLLNAAYNRILIDKAVLCDKLKRKNRLGFIEKVKKLFNRKKELICDWF